MVLLEIFLFKYKKYFSIYNHNLGDSSMRAFSITAMRGKDVVNTCGYTVAATVTAVPGYHASLTPCLVEHVTG